MVQRCHCSTDFVNYADICFREFGDRVKHWITFNEPWTFCVEGYVEGSFAPGRCSPWVAGKCGAGDSSREPYTVCHHQLLAHAAAVKLYRDYYQGSQKGGIGITLVSSWFVPFHKSKSDRDAADRALDFMFGWFMDPLTQGDYPFSMRALVGERLPKFTKKQSKMIKGSFDFIGLNYYTSNYAVALPFTNDANVNKSYSADMFANLSGTYNGKAIGPLAASSWLYIHPPGIRELLLSIRLKYNNPIIYITENGVDEINNGSLTLAEALRDEIRISYYKQHLEQVRQAISDGVDVRGFFAWSLLDNFEWVDGYTVRFGIYYVDYKDGFKRYPKMSALWFRKLLKW
uniref:Beta-glucosidase 12 n=1 Tax=Anthurium amnicola TaxID=1678845 RepID=A0A1D1YFL4_9ARAE